MELFKRVKVMEKHVKVKVVEAKWVEANWSDLIRKNRSIFQSIENAYGNKERCKLEYDEEKFIITWLYRLKRFVSGAIPIDMYKGLYEFILKMVPVLEGGK